MSRPGTYIIILAYVDPAHIGIRQFVTHCQSNSATLATLTTQAKTHSDIHTYTYIQDLILMSVKFITHFRGQNGSATEYSMSQYNTMKVVHVYTLYVLCNVRVSFTTRSCVAHYHAFISHTRTYPFITFLHSHFE